MAENVAPPRGLSQAHTSKTFAAAFAADINLRTQSGYPPHAAQLVEATNAAASAQSVEVVTEDGKTLTKVIPAGATYPFECAIASVGHSNTGEDISIIAYWWKGSGLADNP